MFHLNKTTRFVLIDVVSPFTSHDQAEKDLEELKSLVSTFGGATIVHVIQRRMTPDPGTYIGSGKADEVAEIIKRDRIDVIVVNAVVRPSQIFNLQKLFWKSNRLIEVWDRVDLILHIFEKHAHTAEAKLQIELARMQHMGPRMYGLGLSLFSRQGGGIGTRGLGETNVELMKRHWRDAIKNVNDRLKRLQKERSRQIERRKEIGFKTISIVGYTNAGKTSLFNRLTGKQKLAANVLFATLDSHIGKLYLPHKKKEVLLSDTIGFIQNLPPKLIDAFKSTLMESVNADILLHVIDASDHLMNEKIAVVEQILNEVHIDTKKRIYAFNKIDAAKHLKREDLEEVYVDYTPQFISVKTGEGISELISCIEEEYTPY